MWARAVECSGVVRRSVVWCGPSVCPSALAASPRPPKSPCPSSSRAPVGRTAQPTTCGSRPPLSLRTISPNPAANRCAQLSSLHQGYLKGKVLLRVANCCASPEAPAHLLPLQLATPMLTGAGQREILSRALAVSVLVLPQVNPLYQMAGLHPRPPASRVLVRCIVRTSHRDGGKPVGTHTASFYQLSLLMSIRRPNGSSGYSFCQFCRQCCWLCTTEHRF